MAKDKKEKDKKTRKIASKKKTSAGFVNKVAKKSVKTAKVTKAAAKKAIPISLADFTCPCCSKRCPLSKPKCGKGKAVAKKKLQKASNAA